MEIKNYLIDMDGVLVHGKTMIPGADKFINQLREKERKFLILTNNSNFTPGDLAHRLQTSGLRIDKDEIFTSSMATARFLQAQKPDGTAFVLGESGLTEAVHDVGYVLTTTQPDYVVLGETSAMSFEQITRAIRLIQQGAHFIATNPDPNGPSDAGLVPACGALAAMIERASGRSPFFIGKPNPIMMRLALNYISAHSEETVMVGDRMDTDIVAGLQSGMNTILVLTGVTRREQVADFPYVPGTIVDSVVDIEV
ncbi:MAG TPA: HAD-IIA family hydrolase [Longilinea sp.]|nr:HAD-IIA family hydrolase [Longilinea sp.]